MKMGKSKAFDRVSGFTKAQIAYMGKIYAEHTKLELAIATVNAEKCEERLMNGRLNHLMSLDKEALAHSVAKHARNDEIEIPKLPRGTKLEEINLSKKVVDDNDDDSDYETQEIVVDSYAATRITNGDNSNNKTVEGDNPIEQLTVEDRKMDEVRILQPESDFSDEQKKFMANIFVEHTKLEMAVAIAMAEHSNDDMDYHKNRLMRLSKEVLARILARDHAGTEIPKFPVGVKAQDVTLGKEAIEDGEDTDHELRFVDRDGNAVDDPRSAGGVKNNNAASDNYTKVFIVIAVILVITILIVISM